MPRKRFSDRTLKALQPAKPGARYDKWDDVVRGFGARVNDQGKVTFVFMRRYPGAKNPTRRNIGVYPAISLEAARKIAIGWNSMIAEGRDPADVAEERRREAAWHRKNSFAAIAEEFIEKHVRQLRAARAVEQDIRREFIPRWGPKPINSVTRYDVLEFFEGKRDTPAQARNLFAHLRKIFVWAIARGTYGLENSPCSLLKPSDLFGKPALRQRVLADAELKALWRATGKMGAPFGRLYRLLMLTGARLDEWASATWAEVDLDRKLLTLAPRRVKNDAGHVIPLSPLAVETLAALQRLATGEFIFTTTEGLRPVSGFSKAKTRLDGLMGLSDWRVHDIRRTVRTGLSQLGVQDRIAEMTIGHTVQGLHKVYDQHRFIDERREALERWERHLIGIVEGQPPELLKFRNSASS